MTKKELNKIVVLLGVLSALGPFSIDMYLPGFPAIAADLGTTIPEVGYSLTSYFVGISVGQLLYGPIVDRFGRRKPLIFGLSLYIVAAVCCALSPTIHWLIGLRGLLAIGGCAGMVAGRAVVRDLFPPAEIAKVIATLMLIMGVAPMIAPSIGGWMVTALGWRAIFFTLALICAAMLTGVLFLLPESRGADKSVRLDPAAVTKKYFQVLKQPAFIVFGIAGAFTLGSLFAYISGSPYIYMEKFNFTQTQYGLLFSLNSFGYIGGSQVNRIVLKKMDSLRVAETTSLVVAGLGFLMVLSAVTPGVSGLRDAGFPVPVPLRQRTARPQHDGPGPRTLRPKRGQRVGPHRLHADVLRGVGLGGGQCAAQPHGPAHDGRDGRLRPGERGVDFGAEGTVEAAGQELPESFELSGS